MVALPRPRLRQHAGAVLLRRALLPERLSGGEAIDLAERYGPRKEAVVGQVVDAAQRSSVSPGPFDEAGQVLLLQAVAGPALGAGDETPVGGSFCVARGANFSDA